MWSDMWCACKVPQRRAAFWDICNGTRALSVRGAREISHAPSGFTLFTAHRCSSSTLILLVPLVSFRHPFHCYFVRIFVSFLFLGGFSFLSVTICLFFLSFTSPPPPHFSLPSVCDLYDDLRRHVLMECLFHGNIRHIFRIHTFLRTFFPFFWQLRCEGSFNTCYSDGLTQSVGVQCDWFSALQWLAGASVTGLPLYLTLFSNSVYNIMIKADLYLIT